MISDSYNTLLVVVGVLLLGLAYLLIHLNWFKTTSVSCILGITVLFCGMFGNYEKKETVSLSRQAIAVGKLLEHEISSYSSITDIGTMQAVAASELGLSQEEISIFLNPSNVFINAFIRLGVVPTNFTSRRVANK